MVSRATQATSARRRSTRIRAGDIFEIPAPDGRRGYGQVIVAGALLYVAIFRDLYAEPPRLSDLLEEDFLLVGWTLDALIHHGEWRIVGHVSPSAARVPFPSYKVRVKGVPQVHDFTEKYHRRATAEEWELLENKTTVAPIRYQNALLAHHGFGEWRSDYESLTVEHARRRVLIVGNETDDQPKH
jgi:hypothetical protein